MAKTAKPTKEELATAGKSGMDARHQFPELSDCPYEDGPLQKAWMDGWRGQDAFEKGGEAFQKETVELAGGIVAEVNNGLAEHDVFTETGVESLESHGHNVTEPEVAESREHLAGLMTAFDNHGMQIVEEQWRALTENERTVAASWANSMNIGQVRPVPEFLMPFASDSLKQAAITSFEKQAEQRRLLVRCRFLKPSAMLPTGDDGEDAIKMTVVIPDSEMNRPSLAEEFLHGKRLNIEFSRRSADPEKWRAELPGCESQPEIIECMSDVKGYSRNMTAYKFAFKISTDLIDDNAANREYAKQDGSIRLTLVGDIPSKATAEPTTAEQIANSFPIPAAQPSTGKGPSLFDGDEMPYHKQLSATGEFMSPDEYFVPSQTPNCSATICIGEHGGRFFASRYFNALTDVAEELEEDWGNPATKDQHNGKPNDGYVSLSEAVQSQIGMLIDYALDEKACEGFVNDLRTELKRLTDGGEPHLITDEDE